MPAPINQEVAWMSYCDEGWNMGNKTNYDRFCIDSSTPNYKAVLANCPAGHEARKAVSGCIKASKQSGSCKVDNAVCENQLSPALCERLLTCEWDLHQNTCGQMTGKYHGQDPFCGYAAVNGCDFNVNACSYTG